MRMQSILVRPYVLDCLARFEKAQKEVERQAADPVDDNQTPQVKGPTQSHSITKEQIESSSESEQEPDHTDPDKTIELKVQFAIEYEQDQKKIELPEYAAYKELQEKSKPIQKMKPSRDIQSLFSQQSTAVLIVKENLQKQNEDLKERLRQRKLGKKII